MKRQALISTPTSSFGFIRSKHHDNAPCRLNGEFSTLKDAKISPPDPGFILGDHIHEVVAACQQAKQKPST